MRLSSRNTAPLPRKTDRPVVRIHVMLYATDLTRLRTLYKTTTGISGAIRTMVKYCLDHIEAKLLEKEQQDDNQGD